MQTPHGEAVSGVGRLGSWEAQSCELAVRAAQAPVIFSGNSSTTLASGLDASTPSRKPLGNLIIVAIIGRFIVARRV